MSDAKVNTGERYMMVNMEYHEALKQQNADLVIALELAFEWLEHEVHEPYFETLSEKGMKAYEAVGEALAQVSKEE